MFKLFNFGKENHNNIIFYFYNYQSKIIYYDFICYHYSDYFDWTGKTFRHTNGEFVEAQHYAIKNEDRTHGFKVKWMIGTPIHQEKMLKPMVWHNSKRAGFTPPAEFKIRSPNIKTLNLSLK